MVASPKKLPWPGVAAILILILGNTIVANQVLSGTAANYSAIGGTMIGAFGAMLGSASRAAAASILAVCVVLASQHFASAVDPRVLLLLFAICATIEDAKVGGRTFTAAVLGTVLLAQASIGTGLSLTEIAVFLGSALIGITFVTLTKRAGRLAPPPAGWASGVRQGLFLGIGLALAVTVAQRLGVAQAFWVVLMVAVRAFGPTNQPISGHVIFALGTVVGAGLADLITLGLLQLPSHIRPIATGAVAMGAIAIGLRNMPAKNLIAPMGISISIILASGPDHHLALLRGEAGVFAAAIAVLLGVSIEIAFRLIRRREDTTQT